MTHILQNILACLVIIGTTGDLFTTYKVLGSELGTEANPIEKFIMSLVNGKWSIFRFLMSMFSLYSAYKQSALVACLILAFNVLVLAYVVWNNAKVAKII